MINTDYILNTWIPLLRSGEHEQCTRSLISPEGKRCAVGKLLPSDWTSHDVGSSGVNSAINSIHQRMGIDPYHIKITINGFTQAVFGHNDDGATFAQIADALEALALAEQADQIVRAHQAEPVLVVH